MSEITNSPKERYLLTQLKVQTFIYLWMKLVLPPVQAATIASLIASSFSYLAINLIVRRLHVFGSKKKDILKKIK